MATNAVESISSSGEAKEDVGAPAEAIQHAIKKGKKLRAYKHSRAKKRAKTMPRPARVKGLVPKERDVKMSRHAMRRQAACLRKHNIVLSDRLDQLSKPTRRQLLSIWRTYADILTPEQIHNLQNMLDASDPFKPDQAYEFFVNMRNQRRREEKEKHGKKCSRKIIFCGDECIRRASIALARAIQQRLGRPGIFDLEDGMLRLSDTVLAEMCKLGKRRIPSRHTKHPKSKFMLEMSDKIAVWIDEILEDSDERLLMMDLDEDDLVRRADLPFTDDFLDMMGGRGKKGGMMGPQPAYLKFTGDMLDAFIALTKAMNQKGAENLVKHGKFSQSYKEGADELKRTPNLNAIDYNNSIANDIAKKMAAITQGVAVGRLEKPMKDIIDICSKYLAQNAEYNKDKGPAFKYLLKQMRMQPDDLLSTKGKFTKTMGEGADELEEAKGLETDHDDQNLTNTIRKALANVTKGIPGELKGEMPETIDACAKYLSQKTVDDAERGPVFDKLLQILLSKGSADFAPDIPHLLSAYDAAMALKNAPGLTSIAKDPPVASQFVKTLHKLADPEITSDIQHEMTDVIQRCADFLSGYARDRQKAQDIMLKMMNANKPKEAARSGDTAMTYGMAAKEFQNSPVMAPLLPVKDIGKQATSEIDKDVASQTPEELKGAMKGLTKDTGGDLSQDVALMSGQAGERYGRNLVAAAADTKGDAQLFKHGPYGMTYAEAGETLRNAGQLEEATSKHKGLAGDIAAELDKGVRERVAPDTGDRLDPTTKAAAAHLAKTGVEKGAALDYLLDMMMTKANDPFATLQGMAHTYADCVRKITRTDTLANKNVDKALYESVKSKLKNLIAQNPNPDHEKAMPGIIDEVAKFLAKPTPESEEERKALLRDLFLLKGSQIFATEGKYKITYAEAGKEMMKAPVGAAAAVGLAPGAKNVPDGGGTDLPMLEKAKHDKMTEKLYNEIDDKIKNEGLREQMKAQMPDQAYHLGEVMTGRGEAVEAIHKELGLKGDTPLAKYNDATLTHGQGAQAIDDSKNFAKKPSPPGLSAEVQKKIGSLPVEVATASGGKHLKSTMAMVADFLAAETGERGGYEPPGGTKDYGLSGGGGGVSGSGAGSGSGSRAGSPTGGAGGVGAGGLGAGGLGAGGVGADGTGAGGVGAGGLGAGGIGADGTGAGAYGTGAGGVGADGLGTGGVGAGGLGADGVGAGGVGAGGVGGVGAGGVGGFGADGTGAGGVGAGGVGVGGVGAGGVGAGGVGAGGVGGVGAGGVGAGGLGAGGLGAGGVGADGTGADGLGTRGVGAGGVGGRAGGIGASGVGADGRRLGGMKKAAQDKEHIGAFNHMIAELQRKGNEPFYKQGSIDLSNSGAADILLKDAMGELPPGVGGTEETEKLALKFEGRLNAVAGGTTPAELKDAMTDVIIESARPLAEHCVSQGLKGAVKEGLIDTMQKKDNELLVDADEDAETFFYAAQRMKKAKNLDSKHPHIKSAREIGGKLNDAVKLQPFPNQIMGMMKDHVRVAGDYLSEKVLDPDPEIDALVDLLEELEKTGDKPLEENVISHKDAGTYLKYLTSYEDKIGKKDKALQNRIEQKMHDMMASVPLTDYTSETRKKVIEQQAGLLTSYLKIQGEKEEALKAIIERMEKTPEEMLLRHGPARKSFFEGVQPLYGKTITQIQDAKDPDPIVSRKIQIKLIDVMSTEPPKPFMNEVINDVSAYLADHLLHPKAFKVCKCMKSVLIQCELWTEEILRHVPRPYCTCSQRERRGRISTFTSVPRIDIKECPSMATRTQDGTMKPCLASQDGHVCHAVKSNIYRVHANTFFHPTRLRVSPEQPPLPETKSPGAQFATSYLLSGNSTSNFSMFSAFRPELQSSKPSVVYPTASSNRTACSTFNSHLGRSASSSLRNSDAQRVHFSRSRSQPRGRRREDRPNEDIDDDLEDAEAPVVMTDQMSDLYAMLVSLMWNVQAWRDWLQDNIDRALNPATDRHPVEGYAEWIAFEKSVVKEALRWRQYIKFSRQLTIRLEDRYRGKRIISPTRETVRTRTYVDCQREMCDITEMFNKWTRWLIAVMKETEAIVRDPMNDVPLYTLCWNHFKAKVEASLNDWLKYNSYLQAFWEHKYRAVMTAWGHEGPVWVMMAHGAVPSGAVSAGKHIGEPIWVARTTHRSEVLPGALLPSKHGCVVYDDNTSLCYDKYQVLCNADVKWVPWRANSRKNIRAVKVAPGVRIGRVDYNNRHLVGAIKAPDNYCHVVFHNRSYYFDSYELLVLLPGQTSPS